MAYIVLALFASLQGTPGADGGTIAIQAVDQFGRPVTGTPVSFSASNGTVKFQSVTGDPPAHRTMPVPRHAPPTTTVSPTPKFSWARVSDHRRLPQGPRATRSPLMRSFCLSRPLRPDKFWTMPPSNQGRSGIHHCDQGREPDGSGSAQQHERRATIWPPLSVAAGLDAVNVSFDVPGANISVAAPIVAVSQTRSMCRCPGSWQGRRPLKSK